MQAKTKIIVSALLICLIMGAVVSPVLAAEMSKEELYKKTFGEAPDEQEKEGNLISNYLAELLSNIAIGLYDKLGIVDPATLIYGVDLSRAEDSNQGKNYTDPENMILYTFLVDEADTVTKFYDAMQRILIIPLVVAVVIMGYLVLFRNMSADSLSLGKEYLVGFVIFGVLILFGGVLVEPLFFLNRSITLYVGSQAKELLELPIFEAFANPKSGLISSSTLYWVLMTIVMFFSTAVLNFQYIVRKIILAILLIIFPWVAFQSIFPKGRSGLTRWFKELCGNLFLQSAHAVVYALMLSLFTATYNYQILLVAFVSLSTLTNTVRAVFGADAGPSGPSGVLTGMLGMSAIRGVTGLFARTKDATAESAAKTLAAKGGGPEDSAASKAADSLEKMSGSGASLGTGTQVFQKGLSTGSKIRTGLTAAAGTAGAIAGSLALGAAMGPTGLALGANAGRMIGERIGSIGGETAMALGSAYDTAREIEAEAEYTGKSFGEAFKEHFGIGNINQLADIRNAAEVGASIGSTFGWRGAAVGAAAGKIASVGYTLGARKKGLDTQIKAMKERQSLKKNYHNAAGEYKAALELSQKVKPQLEAQISQYGPGSAAWQKLQENAKTAHQRYLYAQQELAEKSDIYQGALKTGYDDEEYRTRARALEQARIDYNSGKISKQQLEHYEKQYKYMHWAQEDKIEELRESLPQLQRSIGIYRAEWQTAQAIANRGPEEYQEAKKQLEHNATLVAERKAQLIDAETAYKRRNELVANNVLGVNKPRVYGGFSSVYAESRNESQ